MWKMVFSCLERENGMPLEFWKIYGKFGSLDIWTQNRIELIIGAWAFLEPGAPISRERGGVQPSSYRGGIGMAENENG